MRGNKVFYEELKRQKNILETFIILGSESVCLTCVKPHLKLLAV